MLALMTLVAKNIYNVAVFAVILSGCTIVPDIHVISGEAQGTTFSIKYLGENKISKNDVDSLLELMDVEMNTWRDDSRIVAINNFSREDTVFTFYDDSKIWSVLWDLTWEIHHDSRGAFDPTIKPLVDLWGFGLKHVASVDSSAVDSVMSFIGFRTDIIDMDEVENSTTYLETHFIKGDRRAQLDFNAIAQGYTVDMIIDFLLENKVDNAMVELGGEVRCMGVNQDAEFWRIAVDKPLEHSDASNRNFQAILNVNNTAVCTSGNYRKFHLVDGIKKSHTIDPRTGYPVEHSLLSVTIQAPDAATADAYATACMVLGPHEGREFIERMREESYGIPIEALFIMTSREAEEFEFWVSPGWSDDIEWL